MEKYSIIKQQLRASFEGEFFVFHKTNKSLLASIMDHGLLSCDKILGNMGALRALSLSSSKPLEDTKDSLKESILSSCDKMGNSFFLTLPDDCSEGEIIIKMDLGKFLEDGNKAKFYGKNLPSIGDSELTSEHIKAFKGVSFNISGSNRFTSPLFIIEPKTGIIDKKYLSLYEI